MKVLLLDRIAEAQFVGLRDSRTVTEMESEAQQLLASGQLRMVKR